MNKKLYRRLTRDMESTIAWNAARSFTDCIEFCIEHEKDTGEPAKAARILSDEKWDVYKHIPTRIVDQMEPDEWMVSNPGKKRIQQEALSWASFTLSQWLREGKYTELQIKSHIAKN